MWHRILKLLPEPRIFAFDVKMQSQVTAKFFVHFVVIVDVSACDDNDSVAAFVERFGLCGSKLVTTPMRVDKVWSEINDRATRLFNRI
jgi:hypothetical protein